MYEPPTNGGNCHDPLSSLVRARVDSGSSHSSKGIAEYGILNKVRAGSFAMDTLNTDKLFVDDEKYAGMFVATPSFSDTTIVSSGYTIASTKECARNSGYENPVITKIPKKYPLILHMV